MLFPTDNVEVLSIFYNVLPDHVLKFQNKNATSQKQQKLKINELINPERLDLSENDHVDCNLQSVRLIIVTRIQLTIKLLVKGEQMSRCTEAELR